MLDIDEPTLGTIVAELTALLSKARPATEFAEAYGISEESVRRAEVALVNAVTARRMNAGFDQPSYSVPYNGISLSVETGKERYCAGECVDIRVEITDDLYEELVNVELRVASFSNADGVALRFDSPLLLTDGTGADVIGPRQSIAFRVSYTVTAADVAARGPLIASFIVRAETADGEILYDQNDLIVTPVKKR